MRDRTGGTGRAGPRAGGEEPGLRAACHPPGLRLPHCPEGGPRPGCEPRRTFPPRQPVVPPPCPPGSGAGAPPTSLSLSSQRRSITRWPLGDLPAPLLPRSSRPAAAQDAHGSASAPPPPSAAVLGTREASHQRGTSRWPPPAVGPAGPGAQPPSGAGWRGRGRAHPPRPPAFPKGPRQGRAAEGTRGDTAQICRAQLPCARPCAPGCVSRWHSGFSGTQPDTEQLCWNCSTHRLFQGQSPSNAASVSRTLYSHRVHTLHLGVLTTGSPPPGLQPASPGALDKTLLDAVRGLNPPPPSFVHVSRTH
ncbi:splicing factor 3A subunit 2-like [Canis lupus familiaris]|uniref:splicing factor 3A subunit 2-like n=1 Tax=Canis lupus familiaris TaxID=9615 RepID=UPI0018F5036A|nr:splicing factor 3A subunit 2-like [Canis lupus familiaris]